MAIMAEALFNRNQDLIFGTDEISKFLGSKSGAVRFFKNAYSQRERELNKKIEEYLKIGHS